MGSLYLYILLLGFLLCMDVQSAPISGGFEPTSTYIVGHITLPDRRFLPHNSMLLVNSTTHVTVDASGAFVMPLSRTGQHLLQPIVHGWVFPQILLTPKADASDTNSHDALEFNAMILPNYTHIPWPLALGPQNTMAYFEVPATTDFYDIYTSPYAWMIFILLLLTLFLRSAYSTMSKEELRELKQLTKPMSLQGLTASLKELTDDTPPEVSSDSDESDDNSLSTISTRKKGKRVGKYSPRVRESESNSETHSDSELDYGMFLTQSNPHLTSTTKLIPEKVPLEKADATTEMIAPMKSALKHTISRHKTAPVNATIRPKQDAATASRSTTQ